MIRFKEGLEGRLSKEFSIIDDRLKVVLYTMAAWVELRCPGTELTITCLIRSEAEQKAIYGDSPPPSAHTDGRAADIRSTSIPQGILEELLSYVKKTFVRDDLPVIFLEGKIANASTGVHLHVQIPGPVRKDGARLRLNA